VARDDEATSGERRRAPGHVPGAPEESAAGPVNRFGLEWFLARRYLSGERGGSYLSLITLIAIGGVTVGVMALVVVIGVMSGLQTDLRDKILGANPHGTVLEISQDIEMENWRPVVDSVRAHSSVTAASPFIYTEVGLHPGGEYSEGAVLRAIPGDSASLAITDIDSSLVAGEMPFGETASGRPGIVIGNQLANRLGLSPGDSVTVVAFQNAEVTPTGISPRMRRFEVTGVFETGLYQYDTKFTYTPLEEAQDLLGMGASVTGVEFAVADPWRASIVADSLSRSLGFPYQVDDWQEQNRSLFSALKLEKLAMTVILLLIVLVASFNIVSTLVMLVAEKTREIGILRSMGLTSGGILRVFLYQGAAIGVVGTVVGLVLGGGVAWLLQRYPYPLPGDVYFVDQLPVLVDPVDVTLIAVASVLISFLATIYPARQAGSLTPVEAIRHE